MTTSPYFGVSSKHYYTNNQLNTGVLVESTPVVVNDYQIFNRSAAERIIRLYDKATQPTSADTPLKTIVLGAGEGANVAGLGWMFHLGLGVRACTGIADNDNVAPTANDVTVNLGYTKSG